MNLIIDIGNTFTKAAVFDNDSIIYNTSFNKEFLIEHIKKIKKQFKDIKSAILSSVSSVEYSEMHFLEQQFSVIQVSHKIKLPFNNLYKTPHTLGVDRLGLIAAAVNLYPKKNVLVIDAGTCITYDFVTKKKDYLGGAIAPGLRLRYQSLNTFTANLPLLDSTLPKQFIGNSTVNAMHSGVVNGMILEIKGVIKGYKKKFKDLTVILTGGDANFLSKRLKSSIFANSIFLLEGLNFLLEYNKDL